MLELGEQAELIEDRAEEERASRELMRKISFGILRRRKK